ncbi:hypothetical protein [Streptomyces sp. NPDC093568]|uniref:hypothetical protein n=1 Tax=Streptomyces sp. NPDC093568 TaxID=3366041 RepID=UPI00380FB28C
MANLAVVALVLAPALRSPAWSDLKKVRKAPQAGHRGACFADLLPALQRADFTTSVHER